MAPRAKSKLSSNHVRKLNIKGEKLPIKRKVERTESSLKTEGYSEEDDSMWSPNIQTTFKCLASARLCAAVWNNIQDCDETFNYWEPVLFINFLKY